MATKQTEIIIENDLTVNTVEKWYNENKDKVLKNNTLIIKLVNINQLDVAGIQILQSIKNLPDKQVSIEGELNETLEILLERTSLQIF
jgi:ABC-type transporter Mla MlaB component